MFDLARIVGVFQDDEHPETIAVGIVSEDGNSLLIEESDPAQIVAFANRLVMFADEIMTNQNRNLDHVAAMLRGYPEGTTLGQVLGGTAKKTLTAVEND